MRPEDILGYIKKASAITVIIGAGASRAAKIPMAGEIVELIKNDYKHCLNGLTEAERQDYGKAMGALSPKDRKALIEPLLEKGRISWGQIALALMIKGCNLRRILTFNFDLVLEKATSLTGQHLPVYDFGVAPTNDIGGLAEPALFHLHGQSYGLKLLNTEQETKAHGEAIRPLIADSLRNHVVIVAGYSGENDAAFEVMREEFNDQNYLFWLGYNNEPAGHLRPLLKNTHAHYIGNCDFDETMIKLAKGVGVWPPQFVTNPPLHLLEELEDVADFPISKDHPEDLLGPLRRRLEKEGHSWEDGQSYEAQVNQSVIKGEAAEEPAAGKILSDADKKALARSLFSQAYSTWTNPMGLATPELRAAHKKAMELYKRATDLDPKYQDALINWGSALYEEAIGLSGSARAQKLAAAGEKYKAALEIKPDDHEVLFNWGSALDEEAKGLSGSARAEKFAAAGEKYAAALEIKSDYHGAHYNWGLALYEEAKGLSGSARAEKFAAAGEKYAAALEIKPDDHEVLSNWGTALFEEAKGLGGVARSEKLAAAEGKLLEARKRKGNASYNLACLRAIEGKVDAALNELEASLKDDTLPDANHLRADPDMDPIREHPRFLGVLEALEAQ